MKWFKHKTKARWFRLDHGVFPGESYDFKNKESLFEFDNCPIKDANFIRLSYIMVNL